MQETVEMNTPYKSSQRLGAAPPDFRVSADRKRRIARQILAGYRDAIAQSAVSSFAAFAATTMWVAVVTFGMLATPVAATTIVSAGNVGCYDENNCQADDVATLGFFGQSFLVPSTDQTFLSTFSFQYGPRSVDDELPLATGATTDSRRRTLTILASTDALNETTNPEQVDAIFRGVANIDENNYVATWQVDTALNAYAGQTIYAWSSSPEGGQTEQFLRFTSSQYADGAVWRWGNFQSDPEGSPLKTFESFEAVFEATFTEPPPPPVANSPASVPAPATPLLIAAGILGGGLSRRLRRTFA